MPDKVSGLTWIQTVWHSDGIPEMFDEKVDLENNNNKTKTNKKKKKNNNRRLKDSGLLFDILMVFLN